MESFIAALVSLLILDPIQGAITSQLGALGIPRDSAEKVAACARSATASAGGLTFGYALSHHITTQMAMMTVPAVFRNASPWSFAVINAFISDGALYVGSSRTIGRARPLSSVRPNSTALSMPAEAPSR